MNIATKFLRRALYITVFFVGVSALYELSASYDKMIDTTKVRVSEEVMVFESVPLVKDNYVTKSQLIALLLAPLEYDIRIIDRTGSFEIDAFDYNPDTAGYYAFTASTYEKSYYYDRNGAITTIVFRAIS